MTGSPSDPPTKRASFWHLDGDQVLCDLCPRRCRIPDGEVGFCRTRRNLSGELVALNYGKVCASALDPIEKKPLFHYWPGSTVLSVGTFGCNLDCDNCQNSALARAGEDVPWKYMAPEDLVGQAESKGARGVAFTFNEPNVWAEYIMDTGPELRRRDLCTVINTNGYIEPWAAEDLYDHVDAANIDVKAFDERFYRKTCKGKLAEVLETCRIARDAECHVEITYLLIPGMNDSTREVRSFCAWVADEMGEDTPVHLFRFRPAHRMLSLPEEPLERMEEAARTAKAEGLRFVYLAGVVGSELQHTYCPQCGKLLVERGSAEPTEAVYVRQARISRFCPTFPEVEMRLDGDRCPECGERIPIVLRP